MVKKAKTYFYCPRRAWLVIKHNNNYNKELKPVFRCGMKQNHAFGNSFQILQ